MCVYRLCVVGGTVQHNMYSNAQDRASSVYATKHERGKVVMEAETQLHRSQLYLIYNNIPIVGKSN